MPYLNSKNEIFVGFIFFRDSLAQDFYKKETYRKNKKHNETVFHQKQIPLYI